MQQISIVYALFRLCHPDDRKRYDQFRVAEGVELCHSNGEELQGILRAEEVDEV